MLNRMTLELSEIQILVGQMLEIMNCNLLRTRVGIGKCLHHVD